MLFHFLDPCAPQTQRVLNVWTLEPRWELFFVCVFFYLTVEYQGKGHED